MEFSRMIAQKIAILRPRWQGTGGQPVNTANSLT